MKKSFFILILLLFIIQLSSQDKVDIPSFRRSETYPDYELVEKSPIEKSVRKKEEYRIEYEDNYIRTIYDKSNKQIFRLKPDVYKFEGIAQFAVSENGITVFDSYENRFTPEYKTMIKWIDKKGNVINTFELKIEQAISPYYISDKNSWLIFTRFNNFDNDMPSDTSISYGGILVFDEYGNKTLEIDIPSEYDDFDGYSTNKLGELIVASFYDSNFKYSENNPRWPYTIVFNINGGFSQILEQITYNGVFSEDNKLFHSVRTLDDVTSGEVIFKSNSGYHAFPASKESGIIALIRYSYFTIIDYRNKKLLFLASDKKNAKIYSVSPDANEVIIHQKGYAYKYKRKK